MLRLDSEYLFPLAAVEIFQALAIVRVGNDKMDSSSASSSFCPVCFLSSL